MLIFRRLKQADLLNVIRQKVDIIDAKYCGIFDLNEGRKKFAKMVVHLIDGLEYIFMGAVFAVIFIEQ